MIPRWPEAPRSGRPLPRLDGHAGPALPLTPSQVQAAVDAALRAAVEVRPVSAPSRKKVRFAAVAILLAATLGSLAFAGLERWRASHEGRVAPAGAPALPRPEAQQAATPIAPASARSSEDRAGAPAASVVTPSLVEPTVTEPRARSAAGTSADLLRAANALRAARRWREAASAYERVVAAQPGTDDAYAALVAAGSLRSAHLGDPRGALRLFAAADRLEPSGSLAEEVAWNRILSYRALGEPAEEAIALESFVATYADSPWRLAAQTRLKELTK
jgi:tetratricopeptide (TPR) repeat protein